MRNLTIKLLATPLIFLLLVGYGAQAQTSPTTTHLGTNAGTNGLNNTHIGYLSGQNSNVNFNTFIGSQAGKNNTSGEQNTFLGFNTGMNNTTGFHNVFLGSVAGAQNTTGDRNIYIGVASGQAGTSASMNTMAGHFSGKSITTGGSNVMLGFNAGRNTTEGAANSFVGSRAGFNNGTGYNNTYIGNASGFNNINGHSNVFIGHTAGYNETGSNKLYIDNSNTANPLVYGDFGSNQLGVNTSDIPTGYALAVKGKIITEELKIRLYNNWPDYVFTQDYPLMPLEEVEQFIQKNGHLPDIPSADEVASSGFEAGAMNAKLLEKIEELTLHLIEMDKEIKALKKENEALRAGQ